jgi:tetratricopeptide (TPR) repeat protein
MAGAYITMGSYNICNVFEPPDLASHIFDSLLSHLWPTAPAELSPEMRQVLATPNSRNKTERLSQFIDQGAATNKVQAALYAGRAMSEMEEGQLSQAAGDYQRASLLNDAEANYAFGYAGALMDQGGFTKAIEVFREVLESAAVTGSTALARLLRVTALLGQAQAQYHALHFDLALQATQQATDALRELPRENPNVAQAVVVASAQKSDVLLALGRPREAADAVDAVLNDRYSQSPNPGLRSIVLVFRAMSYQQSGDMEAAKQALRQAVELLRQYPFAVPALTSATIYMMQAQVEIRNNPEAVEIAARQVVSIGENLQPRTLGSQMTTAEALGILAAIQDQKGDSQVAGDSLARAVQIIREQARLSPDITPMLAVALGNRAGFEWHHNDLDAARESIAEAIGIDRGAGTGDGIRQLLFVSHLILSARIAQAAGQWPESLKPLQEALRIARQVAGPTPTIHGMIAEILVSQAAAHDALGQSDDARANVDDALTLLSALAQVDPAGARPAIAPALEAICQPIIYSSMRPKQCEAGIDLVRRLVQHPIDRLELSALLIGLATLREGLNEMPGAVGALKEAVAIRQTEADRDKVWLPDLVDAEQDYGRVLLQLGQTDAAETQLKRARSDLAQAPQTDTVRALDARVSYLLMLVYTAMTRTELAIAAGQDATATFRSLTEHDPVRYTLQLADALSDLGEACFADRKPCTRSVLVQAVTTYEAGAAMQQPVDRSREARSLNTLGLDEMNSGEVPKAKRHFETAVAFYTDLQKADALETANLAITLDNLADAEAREGDRKNAHLHHLAAQKLRLASSEAARRADAR